jgi:hypothetical protein
VYGGVQRIEFGLSQWYYIPMKKTTGKRSLEGYKIFPFIAWGLTFAFAVFVYNITTELQDVAEKLQSQAKQQAVQADSFNPSGANFGQNEATKPE